MRIDQRPFKEWEKEKKTGHPKAPLAQPKRSPAYLLHSSVNPLFGRAYRAESKVLSSSFALGVKS